MPRAEQLVRRLLDVAGTTSAAKARITLGDKPIPLFQLLVICVLASKLIDAAIAMSARRLVATLIGMSLDEDVRRQVSG